MGLIEGVALQARLHFVDAGKSGFRWQIAGRGLGWSTKLVHAIIALHSPHRLGDILKTQRGIFPLQPPDL